MKTKFIPRNWPDHINYFSAEGWQYQKEQVAKVYRRYFEKKREIEVIRTSAYYAIFGTEAERRADIVKAELIAFRIYDRLIHNFQ